MLCRLGALLKGRQRLQVQPDGRQLFVGHLTEIHPRHVFRKLVATGSEAGPDGGEELLLGPAGQLGSQVPWDRVSTST